MRADRSAGRLFAAALLLAAAAGPALAAEPPRLAVLPFELIDSSLQGEMEGIDPADRARLAMIQAELSRMLAESGRYELVDPAPAAAAIKAAGRLHSCNACDAAIARRLGADLALVGWVQKVSNLILNVNIGIRDAQTRAQRFAASVDIRGNTDESWRHGIRYLVKRRLLKDNSKIER
jgi:hypothetical protein